MGGGGTIAAAAAQGGNGSYRPPSAMSGIDLGSPVLGGQRSLRSPTPTNGSVSAHGHVGHNGSAVASPMGQAFPSFVGLNGNGNGNGNAIGGGGGGGMNGSTPSPRVSRQQQQQQQNVNVNHHNSYTMTPAHALLLQPLVNSSRSSLESAGSSYHSWDEDHKKDRLYGFFANLDPQQPEWHDITISVHDKSMTGSSTSTTGSSPSLGGGGGSGGSGGVGGGGSATESEEIVRREIGLTKSDFVAIQDKLVTAALTKAATPEGRHRAASLRRRRPSTSQSNYSIGGADNRVSKLLLLSASSFAIWEPLFFILVLIRIA